MLRHRAAVGSDVPARLLYSARSLDEVIYREELSELDAADGVEVEFALTAAVARGLDAATAAGSTRRCSSAWRGRPTQRPLVYVCGPERASSRRSRRRWSPLGHEPARIRTERFGPTGT